MRQYRNKRTGYVVEVPCPLEGPDWEEITEAKPEPEAAPAKKPATKRKAKASD